MAENTKPTEMNEDTGEWNEGRTGPDNTMKEPSHKEYEARDTTPPPSDPGSGGGTPPPAGTGESTTRRGEDVGRQEGKEFQDLGKNKADRPYGTNADDEIGIDGAGDDPVAGGTKLQHP